MRRLLTWCSVHPDRAGQGVLELLLMLTAIIVGFVILLKPFSKGVKKSVGTSGEVIEEASTKFREAFLGDLARLPPQGQEETGSPPGLDGSATGATGSPPGTGNLDGSGSSGGSGRGRTGGASGGGATGGSSPPPGQPGPILGSGPIVTPPPGETLPTPAQKALLDAARALALQSGLTFQLFDAATGQVVTHSIAQIINDLAQRGVSFLVDAGLISTAEALAGVVAAGNADGTFNRAVPVKMVFDQTFLANATKEKVAAVMAHEAWHVEQFFSGIHDDFTHYPRVVDIEYEAFVAGATVWNAVKGSQFDRTLDGGSAAVAQGEARAKEILVSGFGYPTGPRRKS